MQYEIPTSEAAPARIKHEIGIPLSNLTQKGFGLPLPCCLSRAQLPINTVGLKTSDLIFDKRNDRVDNQRSSWQTKPRQLVDEALAAPVGKRTQQSRPAMSSATASAWPGRNSALAKMA